MSKSKIDLEEQVRVWLLAHPVGSEVIFADRRMVVAGAQVCFGVPSAFLRGAPGPVSIERLSEPGKPGSLPTAREMQAVREHAKHGAWVARNKARATGDDSRREEYEGEAESLDLLVKTAEECLALLEVIEGSTKAPTAAEDDAGRAATMYPAQQSGRWHWFDSEGRLVRGPKIG